MEDDIKGMMQKMCDEFEKLIDAKLAAIQNADPAVREPISDLQLQPEQQSQQLQLDPIREPRRGLRSKIG